jgi:hypothetical protein
MTARNAVVVASESCGACPRLKYISVSLVLSYDSPQEEHDGMLFLH